MSRVLALEQLPQLIGQELAVFEATVNDWDGAAPARPAPDRTPIPVLAS